MGLTIVMVVLAIVCFMYMFSDIKATRNINQRILVPYFPWLHFWRCQSLWVYEINGRQVPIRQCQFRRFHKGIHAQDVNDMTRDSWTD